METGKGKEYQVVRRDGNRILICCICDTFSSALNQKKICDKHYRTTCYIQVVKKEDK